MPSLNPSEIKSALYLLTGSPRPLPRLPPRPLRLLRLRSSPTGLLCDRIRLRFLRKGKLIGGTTVSSSSPLYGPGESLADTGVGASGGSLVTISGVTSSGGDMFTRLIFTGIGAGDEFGVRSGESPESLLPSVSLEGDDELSGPGIELLTGAPRSAWNRGVKCTPCCTLSVSTDG